MQKVVVGMGNPLKSDDNIGNIVVDKLKNSFKDKNFSFIRAETNPENFIEKIRNKNPEKIIFIDAILFEGKIGDVKLFSLGNISDVLATTHSIPIDIFKKIFPGVEIKIIGIKPKSLNYGESLSEDLEEVLNSILAKVETILTSL